MAICVEDEWNGWDGDTIVELSDGTYWRQVEYHYEYRYAYRPKAEMRDGRLFVAGMSRGIRVQRISPTVSTVRGEWNGWDGQTVVELDNGQIWQQAAYHYEYKYSYRPGVIIDGNEMQVAGMSKPVKVRRAN